ncbi:hypothetical protein T492DRAFT_52221 [Pavlovales sp. CCMP2436]|nr:hypothetical protein T492DRAFT_52221 [Pavlovales sp. CCMP2436]
MSRGVLCHPSCAARHSRLLHRAARHSEPCQQRALCQGALRRHSCAAMHSRLLHRAARHSEPCQQWALCRGALRRHSCAAMHSRLLHRAARHSEPCLQGALRRGVLRRHSCAALIVRMHHRGAPLSAHPRSESPAPRRYPAREAASTSSVALAAHLRNSARRRSACAAALAPRVAPVRRSSILELQPLINRGRHADYGGTVL